MSWLERRANAIRGLSGQPTTVVQSTSSSPKWLSNRAEAARSLQINVPKPIAPEPIAEPQKPEPNILQRVQDFISNLIKGEEKPPTPKFPVGEIDKTKLPKGMFDEEVKQSGASEPKAPDIISNVIDAYKNYTQNELKKVLEDRVIKLTEEVKKESKDTKKIENLKSDIDEINSALIHPSIGKKFLVSSKQKFMRDLGSVGAGASTLISSLADFYNRVYEQDAETMQKLSSFKETPKVLNWLYKQEAEKSTIKSEVAKETSKDVRKWAEEVSPANPYFMDALKNGVGSMSAFLVASVATGGGATEMAVLEAMSESGTVYRENRDKGKSVSEASEYADKDFLANLVINYYTNKLGIFSDKQAGIRKTIMSGSLEGTQEALQQISSNISTGKDMMEGVPESLAIGGLLGTAVSPLSLGGKEAQKVQETPTEQQPLKVITKEEIVPEKPTTIVYRGQEVGAPAINKYTFFTDSKSKAEEYAKIAKPLSGESEVITRDIAGLSFKEVSKATYLDAIEDPKIVSEYDGIKFQDDGHTSYAIFDKSEIIPVEPIKSKEDILKEEEEIVSREEEEKIKREVRESINPFKYQEIEQYGDIINRAIRVYNLHKARGIDDIATITKKVPGFDEAINALSSVGIDVGTMPELINLKKSMGGEAAFAKDKKNSTKKEF